MFTVVGQYRVRKFNILLKQKKNIGIKRSLYYSFIPSSILNTDAIRTVLQ